MIGNPDSQQPPNSIEGVNRGRDAPGSDAHGRDAHGRDAHGRDAHGRAFGPFDYTAWTDRIKLVELSLARDTFASKLLHPQWEKVRKNIGELAGYCAEQPRLSRDFGTEHVTVGDNTSLAAPWGEKLDQTIRGLIPWRKGPFSLCGQVIEAEWNSALKWNRLRPLTAQFTGKSILDIGCNNGYYMFRALESKPSWVLGIDPSERFYYSFNLVQALTAEPNIAFEPIGVEQVGVFDQTFDVVLCMGIIYHQRDPLRMLQDIRRTLKPGGLLVLESQSIPGSEPVALFAEERYAKARNSYFVPTGACMKAWLHRAKFVDIEIVSEEVTTAQEQRVTQFTFQESLPDFLDPHDATKTIEGYPAPLRTIVIARVR